MISRIVAVSRPSTLSMKIGRSQIGGGEAVGRGVELGDAAPGLQAERIELGFEMAAHAIGADQHQRADRVVVAACARPIDIGAKPRGRRARGAFAGWRRSGAIRRSISQRRGAQEAPVASVSTEPRLVVQRREKLAEARIDGAGGLRPSGLEIGDEGRIRAVEGSGKDVDAGHGGSANDARQT